MSKLIQLHPSDNILLVRETIQAGDKETIGNVEVTFIQPVDLGHKIAGRDLDCGEKIIKYGVSIGSATQALTTGTHIHLHNMKSDYIATYTLDDEFNR